MSIFGNEKESALQRLYADSITARSLLDWFSTRERGAKSTKVDRAETVTGQYYYDIITVFKEMDKIGIGTFKVGRKGHDSRMEWDFDIISIGKIAKGDWGTLEPVSRDAIDDEAPSSNRVDSLTHRFNLRKDYIIEIDLPENFDGSDLSRMKNWLDLLVF